MIRLLLADDQSLVRGALAALLSMEDDFEVVAEVGRGDEVVAAALRRAPDVALLDIEMPGLDGIAAAAALREALPGCRVLVVTTFGRPGYLRRAMEAGASGFVVKDAPAEQLADAIRRVHAGAAGRRPGARRRDARQRGVAADRPRAGRARRRPRRRHGRRHRAAAVPQRGHRAQLPVRRRSARPAPGPAPRRCSSPRSAAGSRPHARDVTVRFHVMDVSACPAVRCQVRSLGSPHQKPQITQSG